MTTLKIALTMFVFFVGSSLVHSQELDFKVDSFRLYAYDANGNTTDYKFTKSISARAASGNVRSRKTGATARVGAAYAAQFQAYIDDLENNHGAVIKFMGGIRRGKCWSGGMHPCGKALDVCQTGRGRVDHRCRLPSRHELARVAAAHGLFEGGQWCHSDYGHAQVGVSAAACGSRLASKRSRHRVASRS